MISIGIDVSKSKSTVAALGFGKELIFKPFNIYHVKNDVSKLIDKIIKDLLISSLVKSIFFLFSIKPPLF